MGSLSIGHLLIVLLVVVLVFGTKKLANVGKDLGGAVRGFKEGMRGDTPPESGTPTADASGRVIDHDQKS